MATWHGETLQPTAQQVQISMSCTCLKQLWDVEMRANSRRSSENAVPGSFNLNAVAELTCRDDDSQPWMQPWLQNHVGMRYDTSRLAHVAVLRSPLSLCWQQD